MKPIFSKIRVLGTAALALFLTASCSDILDEQPRSSYDPTVACASPITRPCALMSPAQSILSS